MESSLKTYFDENKKACDSDSDEEKNEDEEPD